jgi:hypothetical protein
MIELLQLVLHDHDTDGLLDGRGGVALADRFLHNATGVHLLRFVNVWGVNISDHTLNIEDCIQTTHKQVLYTLECMGSLFRK